MQDEFYKKLDKFIDIVNQVNKEYQQQKQGLKSENSINAPNVENTPVTIAQAENISTDDLENPADKFRLHSSTDAALSLQQDLLTIDSNNNASNDNFPYKAVEVQNQPISSKNPGEHEDNIRMNNTDAKDSNNESDKTKNSSVSDNSVLAEAAVNKQARKSRLSSNKNISSYIEDEESVNSSREQLLNSIKKIVERLMLYAVKNPRITIDKDLVATTVPILRKDSKDFTVEDEVILWSSYHELAKLVKPATDYSILIANKLNDEVRAASQGGNFFANLFKRSKATQSNLCMSVRKCVRELGFIVLALIVSIIAYILVQSYCGALASTINESDAMFKLWLDKHNLTLGISSENNSAQDAMQFNAELLNNQYTASIQVLVDLTHLFSRLFHISSIFSNMTSIYCANLMQHAQDAVYVTTCHAFQKNYANLLYIVLSQYLLPLILGIVGSTAYIARNVLEQLQTNSYSPTARGKITMRIFLGGLLGTITGIFISSGGSGELEKFNLNLVMLSLIMGYSVDVAFSLFDRVVERLSDWTDALKINRDNAKSKEQ